MKNNIFLKKFKAMVLSFKENLNDKQQIDQIKANTRFVNEINSWMQAFAQSPRRLIAVVLLYILHILRSISSIY